MRAAERGTTSGLAERFGRFLADSSGLADLVVTDAHRAVAGFSWESWILDTAWDRGRRERRLVARRAPEFGLLDRYDVVEQWDLQRVLWEGGTVPCPEPLWLEATGEATGRPFYVMDLVEGVVPTPADLEETLPEERTRVGLVGDLARVGAEIHRTPLDVLPGALPGTDDARPEREVSVWHETYLRDRPQPIPILDLAFAWLLDNRARISPRRTLVHGDYRLANVIARGGTVAAMLDWEGAHVGDPVEDLANCCMRLQGGGVDTVNGVVSTKDFLALYARLAGEPVSEDAFRYWLVFNDVRSAVVFLTAARRFQEGRTGDLRFPVLASRLPNLLRHVLRDLPDR
ncbi:phosphotransferase family protein [Pseudonocardia pini]|uniref:phosphotransferase family protein n=1 Tax=Pseudonocardia pini TaxID=2758030 RepID=UPI0015F010D8|nr:phosphotransferase family protein [Pseudonocardia pini]